MSDLSRYAFSPLREGDVALYRGSGEGLAPILLVAAEEASLACVRRLENEYALRAELDAAWAARPMALVRHNDRLALVLEDPGGEPLHRLIGLSLNVSALLHIAMGLVGALRQVHERGLVHKDVKPANVLVDTASGGVWLTGFGIASRLPREHLAAAPPEIIAGTLAYMAPEQTGRMNRSVDSRSDLYSLGVALYEMFTGQLPFIAADAMEWVHCHIARQPVPPDERIAGIPGPLSAIVMKLLAKTAEERYQTASGVEVDLRRCLAAWTSVGRIEPFRLGTQDASDRLMVPERLYGREREIDTLLGSFDRVVDDGTPELVLVSGYSGLGKSSVVNELHKALVPPRGLFASGKFDQYKRDIPYATLAQAFRSLVRPLLGQSEAVLCRWQAALQDALDPNGQLITNLIPELAFVIGEQPPVADLPPQETQNRFQMVFRRFLGLFARKEHPLALFLDDLQWLDTATLELLEHLVTHSEVRYLMLVGAYRDNEVGPAHPLMRTLEAIRSAGARVQEIVLAPLGLDNVGRLVADALRCKPERARPLAQLVHEKTGGNPFFAIQFFTALAEEGLLAFHPATPAWQWDIDRIRAKSHTDNVVDLMVGKLNRLPDVTQEALKQLACLGSVADIGTLTIVHGEPEQAIQLALWEAVRAGFVIQIDSAYKFLHDRIQQAAYSLIAEERRAEAHLRIGRVLFASMTADQLAEHLFDVANQLNRGAARLIDRDEKTQVATIDLRAGRKAKASAAYASARAYFSAGMALFDERDWSSQYELTFSLWLERAECDFLTGSFDTASQLIGDLLQRAASKVDLASVYHLKVRFHVMKSENQRAVTSALTCLRLFGIDIPAHPTLEQVQAEYDAIWQTLDGRPTESLIDLPLMTDPELRAAMQMLSVLTPSAYLTDFHLFCLLASRMVNISLLHGMSSASAPGYASFGVCLGGAFHRYREGYRFAKFACDLVEKHGLIAYRAKVYHAMGLVAFWTQPIGTVIDFMRAACRIGTETGDLTSACAASYRSVMILLLRNDRLDVVWRESERGLDFVRKAKFRDAADIILSQQRFIATMQGWTTTFSTFSDEQFDEAGFEAQLTEDRVPVMACIYWILKLKARFLSGDYTEALASADRAKALLWAAVGRSQVLDYFYYTALTVAALYENASADAQTGWRDLLTAYQEQLREWVDNYPPTFGDKHVLVSAEIARLEGRDPDAMRLYEYAIQLAREHGFVQNEGVAHELAAGYYLAHGSATAGRAHLREARTCFARWGADGKVRQLERSYPQLLEEPRPPSSTAVFHTTAARLDAATVIKASQAVSGEILVDRLTATLMTIVLEHAGAGRGLLILPQGTDYRIEAEARTAHGTVEVTLRQADVTAAELPESILRTVIRTRESVILDDATAPTSFSEDAYVQQRRPRSVFCLPLVKQTKLVGVLYLENNLTPGAFTSDRIAVLELLASQAAISLENAVLYAELRRENTDRKRVEQELRRSEAMLTQAEAISRMGSWQWNIEKNEISRSEGQLSIFGFGPEDAKAPAAAFRDRIHPDDRPLARRHWRQAVRDKNGFEGDYRIVLPDGSVKYVHSVAQAFVNQSGGLEFIGTSMDITQRKRAEEELSQAQADLAHVNRVTTLGELTASLAHEVNQPIGAAVTNAESCLTWLAGDTPNLEEARAAASCIVEDGMRAAEIITRIRLMFKKDAPRRDFVDLNEVVRDIIVLLRAEATRYAITVRAEPAADLPQVTGDRVQLQQVLMNLMMNSIDAMKDTDGARQLTIKSQHAENGKIMLSVSDTGLGLPPRQAEQIFEAFFTTKPQGTGMGLSISRSIVESHGGRLWAADNAPRGASFHLILPAKVE